MPLLQAEAEEEGESESRSLWSCMRSSEFLVAVKEPKLSYHHGYIGSITGYRVYTPQVLSHHNGYIQIYIYMYINIS